MCENLAGIVYLLTNPEMPGLLKIGNTRQEDIKQRMDDLYTTGVPVQFECAYAARVANCNAVEDALHQAFDNLRVNPRREFFRIDADAVIPVLKLLTVENVTPQVEHELSEGLDAEERNAREAARQRRRPRMNFGQMGIPPGATLAFRDDDKVQVKVLDDHAVEFNGERSSLMRATMHILGTETQLQPSPYWLYNGKRLKEIYDETYVLDGDE